jgi:hypothetical protein
MAASSTRPSQEQVEDVVKKLAAFRDMLPEDEQRLVNAMFLAAIGNKPEQQGDVQGYWYGYPYTGWYASPWAYSYSYYYPRYW